MTAAATRSMTAEVVEGLSSRRRPSASTTTPKAMKTAQNPALRNSAVRFAVASRATTTRIPVGLIAAAIASGRILRTSSDTASVGSRVGLDAAPSVSSPPPPDLSVAPVRRLRERPTAAAAASGRRVVQPAESSSTLSKRRGLRARGARAYAAVAAHMTAAGRRLRPLRYRSWTPSVRFGVPGGLRRFRGHRGTGRTRRSAAPPAQAMESTVPEEGAAWTSATPPSRRCTARPSASGWSRTSSRAPAASTRPRTASRTTSPPAWPRWACSAPPSPRSTAACRSPTTSASSTR